MENPFSESHREDIDYDLIQLALKGDKNGLKELVQRHQIFVYNVAFKMARNIEDAEDLTQEVFVKAITALGKFERKSSFRTWLYRITVNHFLNTKRGKDEIVIKDFQNYFDSIDEIPSTSMSIQDEIELSDSIEEVRIRCTAGMLLCLDRLQRLIYILGEMFELDHKIGAEIIGISPGNFRIRLMRARKEISSWMEKKCGLVSSKNPCRCSKKTKSLIEKGIVDPNNLQFNTKNSVKIFEFSEHNASELVVSVSDISKKIFQSHPIGNSTNPSQIINEILNNKLLNKVLNY